MNKDVEVIMARIKVLFKRLERTKYWIQISKDKYDQTFNVFFNSQHARDNLRSIPLHKVAVYSLEYLENMVIELKKETKLTIEYTGFCGDKWPKSQRLIQRKRETVE